MKKTLCAIALSLSLSHAGASDVQAHEQFEKEIKSTLAHLSGKSIAGLKVIYLGADMAPWLDTGMNIQPGEQVSVLLNGKVWLSRHYDISLEAPIQVWRRIGPEGKISRGRQATDTFVAEQGGTIQLKNLPTRWLNTQGAYQGEPAPFNPDAGGGVSVAVIRWAPGTDVAAELAKLAGRENSPTWSKAEANRLKTASRQPVGWQYLWELGPADIFSEQHADSRDGGPSHRIDAHTNNDVAILQKEVNLPLSAETALQWSWKVDKLPALAAETNAVSHDYLSIAVEFENGKDLTYLWSGTLTCGGGGGQFASALFELEKCGDYESALRILAACVKENHAGGLIRLAWFHENGLGVPQRPEQMTKYLRQAAESTTPGYAESARVHYATALYFGIGIPVDRKSALQLFRQTANAGEADAIHFLAHGYSAAWRNPDGSFLKDPELSSAHAGQRPAKEARP